MSNENWIDAARKRDEDERARWEKANRPKRAPRPRKPLSEAEILAKHEERRRRDEAKRGRAHEARDWFDKVSSESLADVERRGETSQLRVFLADEAKERERLRDEAQLTRRSMRGQPVRRRRGRYDYDEPLSEHINARNRARRAALLPLDRRCPLCLRVFLRSQSWVVTPQQKAACRGCAAALARGALDPHALPSASLRATREALGITRPALAAMCGYHRSYVQHLEGRGAAAAGPAADRLMRAMTGWCQRAVDFRRPVT